MLRSDPRAVDAPPLLDESVRPDVDAPVNDILLKAGPLSPYRLRIIDRCSLRAWLNRLRRSAVSLELDTLMKSVPYCCIRCARGVERRGLLVLGTSSVYLFRMDWISSSSCFRSDTDDRGTCTDEVDFMPLLLVLPPPSPVDPLLDGAALLGVSYSPPGFLFEEVVESVGEEMGGAPFGGVTVAGRDDVGVADIGGLIPPCLSALDVPSKRGGVYRTMRLLRLQKGHAGGALFAFLTSI